MNKFLAIIPARGGSKGILNKNIRTIGGIPLLARAIQAAQATPYISTIHVSTDSLEIATCAEDYGVSVTSLRPSYLSSDTALTSDVVQYCLELLSSQDLHFTDFILLQPTAPLRTSTHIEESILQYLSSQSQSLVSVCDVGAYHPDCMYRISDNYLQKYTDSELGIRRQDMEPLYIRNGAIYITSVNHFLSSHSLLSPSPTYYIMDRRSSINIDEPMDLLWADFIFSND